LFQAYRMKGMDREAEEVSERLFRLVGDEGSAEISHRLFGKGGTRAVLRWKIRNLEKEAKKKYVPSVYFAELHAQLGDREKTLSNLEAGYQEHSPFLLYVQLDPAYDFLHADPRYRTLMQRIGLPQE